MLKVGKISRPSTTFKPRMASLSDIRNSRLSWAPKGYREFIKLKPYMSVAVAEPATVELDSEVWEFLVRVNDLVNSQAVYLADEMGEDHWGPWKLVDGLRRGDCEDYAIHKLQALIANGYPRGACRLAICKVKPQGLSHSKSRSTYHCVLLVYEANRAPLILDNRFKKIVRLRVDPTNNYEWIAEEYPGHNFWWRKLS